MIHQGVAYDGLVRTRPGEFGEILQISVSRPAENV